MNVTSKMQSQRCTKIM